MSLSSTAPFGTVTRIQIKHYHEVSAHHPHGHKEHNHHHLDTHSGDQAEQSKDSDDHHSHEIFIVGNVFYLTVTQVQELQGFVVESTFPNPGEQQAPREPFLNSIFRPPIG